MRGLKPVRFGRARWSWMDTTVIKSNQERLCHAESKHECILVPTGMDGLRDPAAFVTGTDF